MKINSSNFLLIVFSSLLFSCEADIDIHNISTQTNLNQTLIVPIGSVNLSFGDFLTNFDKDKIIKEDGNEIFYQLVDSVEILYPDLNLLKNSVEYTSTINLMLYNPAVILAFEDIVAQKEDNFIDLGLNSNSENERIDSVLVTNATMAVNVDVSSDLNFLNPSDVVITLQFPNQKLTKLDGSNSDISFSPDGFGLYKNLYFSDFMLYTDNNSTGIPVNIYVRAKNGTTPLVTGPETNIKFSIKFTQLDYKVAFGIFNPDTLANYIIQQTNELNANFSDGSLKFHNTLLDLKTVSNIGSNLNFNLDYLKAIDSKNETIEPVYAWFNAESIHSISGILTDKPKVPGEFTVRNVPTIVYNWDETSVVVFNPDIFEYKFSITPEIDNSTENSSPQFITPDASLKLYITTSFPFYLDMGSYYSFNGSFDNVFESLANYTKDPTINGLDSIALVLQIKNGFPLNSIFKFWILDVNGDSIATDFVTQYEIKSGVVNSDGLVQVGNETNQLISIALNREQLEQLRNAKTIEYEILINGENINSNIHITKLNTIDLKIGLLLNGNVLKN